MNDRFKQALFNVSLYTFGLVMGAIMMYMFITSSRQIDCATLLGFIGTR